MTPDPVPPSIRLQGALRLLHRFVESGDMRDILEAIREAENARDEMKRMAYEPSRQDVAN